MKRNGIMNGEISSILSYMGHTDLIAVSDSGLPIPDEVKRIDLALMPGVPSFLQVLEAVADDMKIEKLILAEEIKEKNPKLHEKIVQLAERFDNKYEIEYISHTGFKERTKKCKAVIRTGEMTPYANIILQSGCIF